MKQFYLLAAAFLLGVGSSSALKCYMCNFNGLTGKGDPDCMNTPVPEKYVREEGDSVQCYTGMETSIGTKSITRSATNDTLDSDCVERPRKGTTNPEMNYMKACLCDTEGCNNQEFEDPPPGESKISCYRCDTDTKECQAEVSLNDDQYLKKVPFGFSVRLGAPSQNEFIERINTEQKEEENEEILDELQLPIGEFEYVAYCRDLVFTNSSNGRVSVRRAWEWFHMDAVPTTKECIIRPGYPGFEYCYCNTNGCNTRKGDYGSGSVAIAASALAVVLSVVMSAISLK